MNFPINSLRKVIFMMGYIWAGMLLLGVLFTFIKGTPDLFTDTLLNSCSDAVYFMIGLSGIMAVWSGLMEIAKESGLIDKIAIKATPITRFLFPEEKNKDVIAMMLLSFTANLFGAGNSSTVFSLKAMEMLDRQNQYSKIASNTMCMFMATSMTMVQLVPITIIKIRSDLGSVDSGNIIIPSILTAIISMFFAIGTCKCAEIKGRK